MAIWGIESPVFWWCWGTVFLAAVCVYAWAQLAGPRRHHSVFDPDTSVYELAYLNGGPHLAITAAAARLHSPLTRKRAATSNYRCSVRCERRVRRRSSTCVVDLPQATRCAASTRG